MVRSTPVSGAVSARGGARDMGPGHRQTHGPPDMTRHGIGTPLTQALPRLHEKLRYHIHVEPRRYLGAHLDIVRQIRAGST